MKVNLRCVRLYIRGHRPESTQQSSSKLHKFAQNQELDATCVWIQPTDSTLKED